MDIRQQLKLFLEPRSIALVGVPRRTGDGHNVLENLLNDGYKGKLYPVNPNADEIFGVKVHHSLKELPSGIVMYMEDVKDGRRFMSVARRVIRKKPIVVLKGGRTGEGAKLTQSHTGSLAGRAEIYDAAFKQCGVIRAADFDELDDLVLSFWYLPLPEGRRLAIMTNTMGAGVLATDACASYGLEMAELAPETKARIGRLLPQWLPVRNPVDTGPAQFVEPDRAKVFGECLDALLSDPGVDAVLFIFPPQANGDESRHTFPTLAQRLSRNHPTKPVMGWIHSADVGEATAREYMEARNVVIYPTVERAARALSRLASYARLRKDSGIEQRRPVED